jgi:hypothetical protein
LEQVVVERRAWRPWAALARELLPPAAEEGVESLGHDARGARAAVSAGGNGMIAGPALCVRHSLTRVDSGRGQNRTLRLLSALWPPVFAGEQDVGPSKG